MQSTLCNLIPYTCDCLDLVHLRSSRLVTVSLVVWGPVLVVWTSFTNYWTMSPLHFTLRSDGQWMCMTQTVPLISSIHHVHYMCVVCILMATVYSKFKYVKPSMQRSSTVYMYMYMYPLGGAGISLPIPCLFWLYLSIYTIIYSIPVYVAACS